MTTTRPAAEPVPADLVEAAVVAARRRSQDVSQVPVAAIAAAAGISRSTLLRRLGGTRAALDDALRGAGVTPGRRPPVRERAIEAAARLIADRGLGAITLEAVAATAGCSLPSLHAVFQGRDRLLAAVFDRYTAVLDAEALAADPPERVEDLVRAIYRAMCTALRREPRVMPAMLADLLARPTGPAAQILAANYPRLITSVGALITAHVRAGRLRPYPLPVLVQLMVGPLVTHLLLRPVEREVLGADLPDVDDACDMFTDAFLRAVLLDRPERQRTQPQPSAPRATRGATG
jgi:AcrR family transcriptional regulator